jgi:tRNA(fMet)-specific endonuclease VapC
MRALLDTDILSEILRRQNAQVMTRYERYREKHGRVAVSSLTVFEIFQGLHKAGRADRAESFRRWLPRCRVIHFDLECARLAGEMGGVLLKSGLPIGVVDVGVAATAVHHGRVLVTGNIAHHERIRSAGFALDLENWRQP